MIKKTVMRTVIIMLAAILICNGSSLYGSAVSTSQGNPGYGERVSEKASLDSDTLHLEIAANGRASLYDKISRYTWVSNPADTVNDTVAFGVNKQRVESQILISYLGSTIVLNTTNFAQCAQEDGSYTEVFSNNDSVVCVYYFKTLGFVIPVEYRLESRKMFVTVRSDQIRETAKNRLIDFSINPFFGGGTQYENGYIMFPDGSGAIIDFNNGKTSDNRLSLDVMYGNKSVVAQTRKPSSQPVLLPCFGISKRLDSGNATMLAYITGGAVGGSIVTNVAGRETSCNYAYYTYAYRESVIETMLDRTYAAKTKLVASEKPISNKSYETCYIFGDPEKSGISAMAEACRDQIFPESGEKSNEKLAIYLDVLMGVRVKQNFLGIPYHTLRSLTTLDDVKTMVDDLSDEAVKQFQIRLRGLSDNGIMQGKIENKLRISRKIGTKEQLNALNKMDSVKAYPCVNPVEFNRNGNGFSTFFDSSLNLLYDTIKQPKYLLAAGSENTDLPKDGLLIPDQVEKAGEKLLDDLTKKSVTTVSPSVLAWGTYCNYSKKNQSDIVQTMNTLNSTLNTLKSKATILLEAPAAYAWNSADAILHLPGDSSHYNLCDHTVPFLQMVLSGNVSYSSEDLNVAGANTSAVLTCIKNGASPAFTVMASGYDKIENTDAKDFYGGEYELCRKTVSDNYHTVAAALSKVYGLQMTDFYEPTDGFTVSVYSDGTAILVNNTEMPVSWNGCVIEAYSYQASETGGVQ